VILHLLKPKGVLLIWVLDYDKNLFGGPPHAITKSEMCEYWSLAGKTHMEQLSSDKGSAGATKAFKLTWLNEEVYVVRCA